ncbi:DUF3892 domain-containing protein [Nannocystis pusilla]|uniref:DUF3892 domain-containing protein n=1 Tax=Nannocystis pusilla TaxID=889268 RepID=UPI003BF45A61
MTTEFWISHVDHETRTDGSKGGIERVCAWKHDVAARKLTDKKSYTRAQVVALLQAIDLGTRARLNVFYTTTLNETTSTWDRGAEVVLTRDGKYITTTPTDTTRDNLDELPKCDC